MIMIPWSMILALFHRSLSDLDNDGKLTTEEFTLAMYLVDLVKSGQTLPDKLPPELLPPTYKARKGSVPVQHAKPTNNQGKTMVPNITQPANNMNSMPGEQI